MSSEPNEQPSIIYQILGIIFALAGVIVVMLHLYLEREWSKYDFYGFCLLLAACFALLRPRFFDDFVKWAAEKIPFINYVRPPKEGE